MLRRFTCFILLLTFGTPSAIAQSSGFLPVAQVIPLIVDGRPWSAQTSDGKSMKITLNKDGSASITGPMPFSMPLSWEAKGEQFCLKGPKIAKCIRFRQVAGGYEGWNGNALDLKLTR